MESAFGTLLREWRTARRLSLGKLAQQAGVGKTTLSYWESGARQPSLAELDSVLNALGVTAAQRVEALRRVDAPRAVRRLRKIGEQALPEGPPVCGDLLRAMRHRAGKRLEEVATHLDLNTSTVSRWERSEAWPSPEALHALCFFLSAHPEEVALLTSGHFSLAPPEVRGSLADLSDELGALRTAIWQGVRPLMDLRFLSLQARLWPLARSSDSARQVLASSYASHAQWLSYCGRYREMEACAHRALETLDRDLPQESRWFWSVHLLAGRAASRGKTPLQGAELLQHWLPATERFPQIHLWFRLTLSGYLAAAGKTDPGLEISASVCRDGERIGYTSRHVPLGHARNLLRAGRADEALPLLPRDESPLPLQRVTELLTWTEAWHAVGDSAGAHRSLQRACDLIQQEGLGHMTAAADRVAQKL